MTDQLIKKFHLTSLEKGTKSEDKYKRYTTKKLKEKIFQETHEIEFR